MIKHGTAPFLECSSKGDKRFSAFFARIAFLGNKSIEEIYQGFKVLPDGTTGNSIKKAKGKPAANSEQASNLYRALWVFYVLRENPELLPELARYSGLSDVFGQKGHCCQASVLWDIREAYIEGFPLDKLLFWAEEFLIKNLSERII